ncbi:hypothetical protein SUGI_1135390 [Cryptomeria japonica]|nr:hypothetical protein SUGI_1135390 [Cryptomeria japonica]
MQAIQEPDKVGVTDRFMGSKHSNPRLNHGNPYSSGNEILRQIKQGFGDLTIVQLLGTLDRIRKDAQIFGEQAPSLSGPIFINSKVWIRLYNCPSDYWHIDVINDICKNLGTFVSADDILEDKLWGSFLRICISTNQVNKIPDEVRIFGVGKIWIQKIDREDHLHICPIYFSLNHSGISYDVSALIQRNYSYMQSPIEVKLQPKPLITNDSKEALCNDTLEKENGMLTEATPLIIVPPPSGQIETQQDLLTLLEKTKSLHTDIESMIADSLPPSPFVPRIQLAIEDRKPPSQDMENNTIGVLGGQTSSPIGIDLEDGEIETSSSEGEEDFEPDSDLIMEGS